MKTPERWRTGEKLMLEGMRGLDKWGMVWKKGDSRKQLQESLSSLQCIHVLPLKLNWKMLNFTKHLLPLNTISKVCDANCEPMCMSDCLVITEDDKLLFWSVIYACKRQKPCALINLIVKNAGIIPTWQSHDNIDKSVSYQNRKR